MKKYKPEIYKAWYEKNKERIRDSKTKAKKKYRRTKSGLAAQRKYNKKPSRRLYVRNYNFLKRYGITLEKYEELYKDKDGKCDVCGEVFDKLHIDHSHKTGEFRGLLCGSCNRALGLFKDDLSRLSSAIDYLSIYV